MENEDIIKQGNKTIVFEIKEDDYEKFLTDNDYARTITDKDVIEHPELFPEEIKDGYSLNGISRESEKCGYKMRKIKTKKGQYQIRPSFLLPYGRGLTDVASKGLLLAKYNVPFHVIAQVLGNTAKYWYQLYLSIGRNSIVGTTIKDPEKLPEHLLADEEHTRVKGKKKYIATTVGSGCILGSEVTESASEERSN